MAKTMSKSEQAARDVSDVIGQLCCTIHSKIGLSVLTDRFRQHGESILREYVLSSSENGFCNCRFLHGEQIQECDFHKNQRDKADWFPGD